MEMIADYHEQTCTLMRYWNSLDATRRAALLRILHCMIYDVDDEKPAHNLNNDNNSLQKAA